MEPDRQRRNQPVQQLSRHDQHSTANNIERVRLSADGFFGIGTATPATPLQVNFADHTDTFQLRFDGYTPGINMTGPGDLAGTLRFRNKLEVWPDDDLTRTAGIDIRDSNGNPMINLPGTGDAYFKQGNVGIGTDTPAYLLDVNGTAQMTSLTQSSDARYKTHIATFPNALETVLGLRGVTFDWNRDLWQDKGFATGRQVGFIAQEVESVLPELVTTDASGYKAVAYQNVVPVLVEAVKTLKHDNDSLRSQKDAEVAELRAENAAMKARLDTVEKLLLRNRKP